MFSQRFYQCAVLWLITFILLGCGSVVDNASVDAEAEVKVESNALLPTPDGRLERMMAGDVKVLIFMRTDCPIANRYAPAIRRLCTTYDDGVVWWLVYPNAKLSRDAMDAHLAEYDLPCNAFRDEQHQLVRQTGAKITPEAAVYGKDNRLIYCGRIDDWYVDFGQSRPQPTQHDLEAAIQAALNGSSVSPKRRAAVGCYIDDLAVDVHLEGD